MVQALYLKYRPRTFGEIEGQEHVTRTLKNALALGRTAQAYLFTGPRGTGKTSTARILAKAVNCLATEGDKPCNQCAVCQAINAERMLDLIEIDGASNNSVDDVRGLREKADLRPGEAKYRVYIIDEVHMLSTSAFNALLKTLEEPPPHVIFILATTDPQKIPATVLSRVQRFDFRRLTLSEIVERLGEIIAKEGLKAEPPAVDMIARHATGAMRDAISLLDQLVSYGGDEITLAQVQGLLGAASHQAVSDLVCRLATNDVSGGLAAIAAAVDNGADTRQLAREIVEYLRALLLIQVGSASALTLTADAMAEMTERAGQFTQERLLRAIRLFSQAAVDLRLSANPTLPLEIALVEATMEGASQPVQPMAARETAPRISTQPVSSAPKEPPIKPPVTSKRAPQKADASRAAGQKAAPAHPPAQDVVSVEGELTAEVLTANWSRVLARVRVHDKMSEAVLRSGAEIVRVEGGVVTLGFPYQVHMERFEKEPKVKMMLEKALEEIFQRKCIAKCILSPQKAKMKAAEEDPLIRAAVSQLGAKITEIHEGE